jgi:hypothetical protein
MATMTERDSAARDKARQLFSDIVRANEAHEHACNALLDTLEEIGVLSSWTFDAANGMADMGFHEAFAQDLRVRDGRETMSAARRESERFIAMLRTPTAGNA